MCKKNTFEMIDLYDKISSKKTDHEFYFQSNEREWPNSFEYIQDPDILNRWGDYDNQDIIVVYVKDVSYVFNLYRDMLHLRINPSKVKMILEKPIVDFKNDMRLLYVDINIYH
ncbi:MAG TPA: hypothetical protein VIY08_00800 [Candidatus Nitrosocosmicus sp.]